MTANREEAGSRDIVKQNFKEELGTMSVQVEKLEKNMAKLTIEVSAEEFDAAMEKAYQKNKGRITLPGFRRGKAPCKMIEKVYGAGIFYEDAANAIIPKAYSRAAEECGEEIVSQPSIDVTQIGEGQPFIFTAEVALKPGVTLGEYKGLEVEKTEVAVSEEEVDAEVNRECENNSRMIDIDDRAVQDGDMIKLNFEGFVDGEAFAGGKGEDYPLTIGSGSFIPGFEEQLIGAEIGADVEVNVTFPEDYQAEELQGKAAVFKCKVNEIKVKELPELDDEFAKDVSEFDTLAEYKDDIRAKLLERKTQSAKNEKQNKVVEKAVANATMEIPDAMVDEQVRRMADDFTRRIESQGLSMEQYMQFTGMTPDQLLDQMKPEALKRIQNSLVLEAIAKAEDIQISDDRIDEEITKMAESYKMEADKLKGLMGDYEKEQMKNDLAIQTAVELITDAAKEV